MFRSTSKAPPSVPPCAAGEGGVCCPESSSPGSKVPAEGQTFKRLSIVTLSAAWGALVQGQEDSRNKTKQKGKAVSTAFPAEESNVRCKSLLGATH